MKNHTCIKDVAICLFCSCLEPCYKATKAWTVIYQAAPFHIALQKSRLDTATCQVVGHHSSHYRIALDKYEFSTGAHMRVSLYTMLHVVQVCHFMASYD